jgi:peptidoglycan hydrolase-like protein with peptidoglycan-binding domain
VSGSVQPRPKSAETAPGGNGAPPARRSRRRLLWAALAVAGSGAVGVAAWALVDVGGTSGSEAGGAVATATTEVTRRNLARTETFAGTLGFADPRTVTSNAPGTVTALAPEGATRRRGGILYRVDQRPVVLLIGELPAWRRLEAGVEGRDVLQLERNLKRLGYDPGTVDREFDWETEAAAEEWQQDLGVEEIGAVELGDVLFSPGPVRVGSQLASVGEKVQPGSELLEVSSATQIVTVELEVADRPLVAKGDEVTVELPDESELAGTIVDVGTVAQATTDEQTGETTGSTVEVTIELSGGVRGLDEAPVDVIVVTDSKEGVLAVPVTALVALLGGGYGVEVPDGETTRVVAVEPGMYADGYVEVVEGELAEGDIVVVPQ